MAFIFSPYLTAPYERVGLLEAKRADNNNYRYYDESEVERIKQIMVLRKMQISIKDIIRIYENEDMSTVVEVFVNRINAIDEEVGALTELKRITNDFLQTMLKNGVTKITALPIIYEQMEKQLDTLERCKTMNYTELSALSDKLVKPVESSILSLPSMRVLSSLRKDGISDPDGFWRWVQTKGLPQGEPGQHERFEFQTNIGDVFILRVADDFVNDGEYSDYILEGCLFAAVDIYLDEDIGERFRALIKYFDGNKYYQIDYRSDGSLRHTAMLENLISPDDQRELVALLVPVKKRMADPALFDKPEEITGISVTEIEAANPILWEVNVPLDKLTQSSKRFLIVINAVPVYPIAVEPMPRLDSVQYAAAVFGDKGLFKKGFELLVRQGDGVGQQAFQKPRPFAKLFRPVLALLLLILLRKLFALIFKLAHGFPNVYNLFQFRFSHDKISSVKI